MSDARNEEMQDTFPHSSFPAKPWIIISINKNGDRIPIGRFYTRGEAERQLTWLSRRIPDLIFQLTTTIPRTGANGHENL